MQVGRPLVVPLADAAELPVDLGDAVLVQNLVLPDEGVRMVWVVADKVSVEALAPSARGSTPRP